MVKSFFRIVGLMLLGLLTGCGSGAVMSASGIVFVSERDGEGDLYRMQVDGTGLLRLTDDPALDTDPAWSADGTQIAFRSRRTGNSDIYVMEATGGRLRNLIDDPEDSWDDEFAPSWAPDGQRLAIITDRFNLGGCSAHQVALLPLQGGRESIQLLDALSGNQRSVAWSPDGRRIAFNSLCQTEENNVYLWDLKTRTLTQLTEKAGINHQPAWSYSGRWLAFASNRGGDFDIYRLEIATGELVNLTNHQGADSQPTWSPDDSQLAFVTDRDGNEEIYVMAVDGSTPINLTQNPARDYAPAWSPVK